MLSSMTCARLAVFAAALLLCALPSLTPPAARAASPWLPVSAEERAATDSTIQPGAGAEIL